MLQTLGSFTIPVSPADGVVESIKDGVIVVRDKAGGRHAVDYEDNLPLATKTLLHNDITVRTVTASDVDRPWHQHFRQRRRVGHGT